MKWKKWRGGEPSKQKKNCGRHDSTHSHRRNTTFSRVFLRFFLFSRLSSSRARFVRLLIYYIYVLIIQNTHTHTHSKVEALNFHTLCASVGSHEIYVINANRKMARAAPSTFAQLTMRTSTTTTSAILIYCVCDHHAVIPVETHINLSGGAITTHTKLSSNIHFICNQKILFLLESSECMRNW